MRFWACIALYVAAAALVIYGLAKAMGYGKW